MSFSISDAFVQQFTGNVRFLAQQMKARLSGRVVTDNVTGESAYMEQVAPSEARDVTVRHADSPIMNTQHLRRRLSITDSDWGDLVDKEDKVRLLIDPTSVYARNGAAALERKKDSRILFACWATAYTGHNGNTAVTWPNGNNESAPAAPGGTQVGVADWTYGNGSGNAGLTISKLVSASVALDAAEGDDDMDGEGAGESRYCVIAAKQKGNLLATTEATLKEFGVAKDDLAPLRDGKITTIMGFELIHSERLLTNGSGYTRVPAWRKSALGMGIATDINGEISKRADKRFSWYVYASMSIGASRLEEAKLVELICQ
jgi:hypothetical protein